MESPLDTLLHNYAPRLTGDAALLQLDQLLTRLTIDEDDLPQFKELSRGIANRLSRAFYHQITGAMIELPGRTKPLPVPTLYDDAAIQQLSYSHLPLYLSAKQQFYVGYRPGAEGGPGGL